MKADKQRIAIAEACGWHRALEEGLDEYDNYAWWTPPDRFGQSELHRQADIPNYPSDLNAMHEAWCRLTTGQHAIFRQRLADIVVRDGHVCGPCRSLSNATAPQRAEAFLRTIGCWEFEERGAPFDEDLDKDKARHRSGFAGEPGDTSQREETP